MCAYECVCVCVCVWWQAMLALKKQQARAKVAKEAQHAPAATLTGAAAREDKAPAFQWLKKHVLAGDLPQ